MRLKKAPWRIWPRVQAGQLSIARIKLDVRRSEEAIGRAWQPEIFPERRAFVITPEKSATLEFRYDAIDEIVKSSGQIGKHDVEAIGGIGEKPFLHLVGDCGRGADECQSAVAANPLRELAHGQILALCQINDPLASALARITF